MEGFLANLSEWMYICNSSSIDDLDPLTTSTAPMAIIPRTNINKIYRKLKVRLPCIIVLYASNEIISQQRFFKAEHMDTAKWNTFFPSTIKHPGHSGFFFILMISMCTGSILTMNFPVSLGPRTLLNPWFVQGKKKSGTYGLKSSIKKIQRF